MKPTNIDASSISDFWFQSLWNIFQPDTSYEYIVEEGSYEGQKRLQFYDLNGIIRFPSQDIIPIIPPGKGEGAVIDHETIEKYFMDYIMSPELNGDENYTYGSRITIGLDKVIEKLRENRGTNHAVLEIGTPRDIKLEFPPCLRLITFHVFGNLLSIKSVWRSNDIFCALPLNLAGMQRLKEYVAIMTGLEDGPMFYSSCGSHIYEHNFEQAKKRITSTI